jgi:hypothetical protein
MAINKVGSKGIEDGAIAAIDLADEIVSSDKFANTTIENAKLSNSSITTAGATISLGGSVTFNNQFVDWQSVITSDGSTVTTMESGKGYFIDNSSAAGIVKLPASASIGDVVSIKDYSGNFGTNNTTVQRNSHNIQGNAVDITLNNNRKSVVMVYVDSTKGWLIWKESDIADLQVNQFTEATGGTVATSGDFKIHTFTGDGCFVVSQVGVGPAGGPSDVDYLVVAGGGGGGFDLGGGGGAGGHRTTFPSPSCNAGAFPISAQTYPITVGAGGAGGSTGPSAASSGSNSVFSTITSAGGGGGGSRPANAGVSGGSGGGGGADCGTAGSGNTPPVSPSQGNNGGTNAGGGGGAGGAGANQPSGSHPRPGGHGGNGAANSITASSVTRAGGGGAGSSACGSYGAASPSAPGGGGVGRGTSPYVGGAGTANLGAGGGGGSNQPPKSENAVGGAGGKGVVIIRYKFQ